MDDERRVVLINQVNAILREIPLGSVAHRVTESLDEGYALEVFRLPFRSEVQIRIMAESVDRIDWLYQWPVFLYDHRGSQDIFRGARRLWADSQHLGVWVDLLLAHRRQLIAQLALQNI